MGSAISVIVPTFNRAAILRKTLEAYAAQSGDHRMLEILVVDDGSTDNTAPVVKELSRTSPVPVRHLYQQNSGLASARNHAIREAKGRLLLFGDDDIIPTPGMVAEHVAWHDLHPGKEIGVLGHVAWAREVRPTPFMVWSGLYGPQFRFGYCKPGLEVEPGLAYFCNTSVKTQFLRQNGVFDEAFRQYGWEDIELSCRLFRKGYRLLYNPKALGYHHKYETFDDTLRRSRLVRLSVPAFEATDGGRYYAERTARRAWKQTPIRRMVKLVLRPFKPLTPVVMPLVRPLLDTQIPLPYWVYRRVFHYYAHERQPAL